MDLVYVGVTLLFFVVAGSYVAGCDRLGRPRQGSAVRDRNRS
jgi:hypothetical protein